MSEIDNNAIDEKRLLRQKKRKKSRAIAFLVLFIILIILGVGGYFGVTTAINKVQENNLLAKDDEADIEQNVEPEEQPEEPTIMTPDVVEEPEDEIEPEEVIEEETEPEQSPEELYEEMIRSMIAEMTLEDKVAGVFIISPELLTGQNNVTLAGEGTKAALEKYPLGGIIYAKQNIKDANQLKTMLDNTKEYCKYPMFIGINEESGKNAVLRSALKLDATVSAKELGQGDSTATYDNYNTIGSYLAENQFDLNFSVSANVGIDNGFKLGDNSFGNDPATVSIQLTSAVNGLKEAGIVTCVKNFPGQGGVNSDPSATLAENARTKQEMEEVELVPFKAAIEANVDMIMVGNYAAPELTEDKMPCSMSKAVMTELLRNEMGYEGVIITDWMNVTSIIQYYGADEVAVKAIKAGADMVLCPENFELAYNAVIEAVKDGTIDERRIDDSLARIYKIKYRDTL